MQEQRGQSRCRNQHDARPAVELLQWSCPLADTTTSCIPVGDGTFTRKTRLVPMGTYKIRRCHRRIRVSSNRKTTTRRQSVGVCCEMCVHSTHASMCAVKTPVCHVTHGRSNPSEVRRVRDTTTSFQESTMPWSTTRATPRSLNISWKGSGSPMAFRDH